MKYENFERVKEIIKAIDKTKERIDLLNQSNLNVTIFSSFYGRMNIHTEDERAALTANFIVTLLESYKAELKALEDQLELL